MGPDELREVGSIIAEALTPETTDADLDAQGPWIDEAVFDRADAMDVLRNPNEHMTFGRGGPHMCLGNALARIELRVMFEDLLSRIDKVEMTSPIDYLRSNFVHGIKRMPVKVTLR